MSLAILFLTLILSCSGSVAQFTVTQDAAMSGSPGENVRVTCSRSGGSVTGYNYPSWYLQTPGSVPKLLVYSSSNNNHNTRPSGISDRFSAQISGGSVVLSISRLQIDDEGMFSCALYAGGDVWIFGGGTMLSVITGEVKVPSVFIYPPSEEELKTNSATVVCTASNYRPSPATMEFLVDGQKLTNGVYTSPVAKQSDSSYMGSSFLTMTASDYNKYKEYSCKVTHQGKEFIQILKRSECF